MTVWILKITAMYGITEYGYKFLEQKNCIKVGTQITKVFKKTSFSCKMRKI